MTSGENARIEDPISLREFSTVYFERWRLIAVCAFLAGAIAAITAALLPRVYKATVVVSPVSETAGGGQMGALGSLAAQFGGLAALAGVSIGQDTKKAEALAVLQSEALTTWYIKNQDLLPALFASRWDAKAKAWKKEPPTLWRANQLFKKKVRTVTADAKSGIVNVSISWTDPELAAKWANDLVRLTNVQLRDRAIREAEENIAYLTEQAAKTDIVGIKEAIYTILQHEINKAMLARGTQDFAFKILDPAVPPEKPVWPGPLVWFVAAVIGVLVVAALVMLAQISWRRQ